MSAASSELDYIQFCCAVSVAARFVLVCQKTGCQHSLFVPFCGSRESGLMLVSLLCSGHVFPHSASAASETRRSCPGKKYRLKYDNDHNLYLRG